MVNTYDRIISLKFSRFLVLNICSRECNRGCCVVFHPGITLRNFIPMARMVSGDSEGFVIINDSETNMESCCRNFLD